MNLRSPILSRAVPAMMAGFATLIFAAATPARVQADPIGDQLKATTDKLAPCIVSIRTISTMTQKRGGQTQDHDVESDLRGVVVSSDGLIMCSNSYFSSDRIKDALGIPTDQTSVDVSIVTQEIKVTVGDESTEYYGTLAASDSNLGLAFIQIRDLKGRALPFVDLIASASASAPAFIGESTSSTTRLDKTYDYAPLAVEDRIVGLIDKPRKAYVPEGFAAGLGLPVYGSDGNVLGVVTTFTRGEVTQAERESDAMSSLFGDELAGYHSQFIIPIGVVAPLISIAKTRAANLPVFVVPTPRPPHPATPAVSGSTAPPTAPPSGTPPAPPPSTSTAGSGSNTK